MGHVKTNGGRTARAILGRCATAFLLICAFASPSLAAPNHPRTSAHDVPNLNKACGAAADKQGDLYASSTGEGKVKVFDTANHTTPIAEIANANAPCALAVNSKGNLLVSERATGEVVSYTPDAYPLTAAPVYGARQIIDASGDAEGISVDPFDDRLYVAEDDHVAVYTRSEVQSVGTTGSGGSFKLRFEGAETAPIAFNASAAEVQAALEALATIDPGEVAVSGSYTISFLGALAYIDVPQVEGVSSLTGSEKQKLTIQASAGTYKLSFEGEETAAIAFNASAAAVQAALEALGKLAPGDVAVSGGPGDAGGTTPYELAFGGAYADANVNELSADASGLAGGTASLSTTSEGAGMTILPSASSGGLGTDEVQQLALGGTGGTYKLSFEGEETAPIAFNASAAAVQAALEALGKLAPGDVAVGASGFGGFQTYRVGFGGAYAATDVPQLNAVSTALSPSETQRVTVKASAGTYKLTFEAEETTPIAFNASAAEVQAALEALGKLAPGDVAVSGGPGDAGGTSPYEVAFGGAYAGRDLAQMTSSASGLAGGSASVTTRVQGAIGVSTATAGWNGHALEGTLAEATGVAAYTNPNALGASLKLNLAVADGAGDELEIYSGSSSTLSLKLRKTVTGVDHDDNPGTAEQEFSFGTAGAYLAADRGNENTADGKCIQVQVGGQDQACTQGHFFLHDAGNEAIDEFGASGEFFAQLTSSALEDAEPTQVAVERSGGANDGTLYAGSGSGAGASLLAFAPVFEPSRQSLPAPFSKVLASARAVAVDCEGFVYVAAGTLVRVYSPAGAEVVNFEVPSTTLDLAADCSGNVYVVNFPAATEMTYYPPSSYPPSGSTTYTRHTPALVTASGLSGVAVNPANEHAFVVGGFAFTPIIKEFAPPSESSKVEGECGAGLGLTNSRQDIDVYGKNGNVYVTANAAAGILYVLKCGKEAKDAELIREVREGGGCDSGDTGGSNPRIAINQSNGNFVEYANNQPGDVAREYDAFGACIAQFGTFAPNAVGLRLALDNSCALHKPPLTEATTPTCADTYPSNGTAYVANDSSNNTVQPFDVNAFGPLEYGAPPEAVTGIADGFGPGGATLHGTVDPEEFELEECTFQYLTDEAYEENLEKIEEELIEDPFEGALTQACEETPAEIGKGSTPVPVHAEVTGIEPESTRYRYRLHATNPFGEDNGEAALFGPPLLATQSALPVGYDEATLRAKVNPSGLLTTYRFEYLTEEEYEANGETFAGAQSTPEGEIPPGDGEVAIEVPVTGLAQGTVYRFRIIVENATLTVEGPPQAFETLVRPPVQNCENAEYRTGLSALLPDCRAYELVTPPQTISAPGAFSGPSGGARFFNSWLVAPRGPGAGESVAFRGFVARVDGHFFRAERGPGAHPEGGWESEQSGLTFVQGAGLAGGAQGGVSPDQRYWLHQVFEHDVPSELAFPIATYMRVPSGQASRDCAPEPEATFELADPTRQFELVGCGTLGTDPEAAGRYIGAGGTHVIFTSKEPLEGDSPPAGTEAIYDREAGKATAEVVSLKPDGTAFGAGEDARYIANTEDGAAVVFTVADTLYVHRSGETTVVAEGGTYAGISTDGERVFFIDDTYTPTIENPMIAAGLFACDVDVDEDVEADPCAGPGAHEPTEIAPNSVFVNVSADGSHAFFLSEDALPGVEPNEKGKEAEDGETNLYAWDGTDTHFVALLHPQDLLGFSKEAGQETFNEDLLQWTNAIPGQRQLGAAYEMGRAFSPTRSTPDGEVLVFQSHAKLTGYDNEEKGEIYRYVADSAPGPQLSCVSCSPSGAPHASASDALLQSTGEVINADTLVPNVTDDGSAVVFESSDTLLPEDANATLDVYEWKAFGTEGPGGDVCQRPGGCLALISTGQSEEFTYLFGMTADGEDVFIFTREELAGADISASFSLYDARVLGGIPDPPAKAPCEGDACQPPGTPPPLLPAPATTGTGNGNEEAKPPRRCAKGKHRVKGRCVPKKHRKRSSKKQKAKHAKQRANHDRGTRR